MKKELEYALEKFEHAVTRLKEGTDTARHDLEKDGVIQRFEFTFELLWKTLKIFLQEKGILAKTPKDTLKESFKLGWIKDEEKFLNMLQDRNLTSHIYDRKTSAQIFERIKNQYTQPLIEILASLKK